MRHWKMRSKSQSRIALESRYNWTIEGQGRWRNSNGQLLLLKDSSLLQVAEVERLALQRLALTRLQELNLGCYIEIPKPENVSAQPTKKKTMLLRKKAVTTTFFENKEKDKNSNASLAVFGVTLDQCITNDRLIVVSDSRKSGKQKDHCEEVLSALRIPSQESSNLTSVQLISSMITQKVSTTRRSIPDIFPGELQVPLIVQACIRFLNEKGLRTLGIFRVSGSQKRVRQLREDLDTSRILSERQDKIFNDSIQPHDVAQLLKEYFRDLPEPLLTRVLYRPFLESQKRIYFERKLKATRWLMYLLPVSHRDTLSTLLNFLEKVAKCAEDSRQNDGSWVAGNKMDANNLATVFGPNLLRMSRESSDSPYPVTSIERAQERSDIILTVRFLIEYCYELFQVPPEDFDAVYQQFMIEDPDLLNALLIRRLNNQRYAELEGSSGSSSNRSLLNNQKTFQSRQASNDVETSSSSIDWNVKSEKSPLRMSREADIHLQSKSKEIPATKWTIISEKGSSSKDYLQPYSVTASFTITMTNTTTYTAPSLSPQLNYTDNPERSKARRVPYGKLRHMTTPDYYTEESITTVIIPPPRNASVSRRKPVNYKPLAYEGFTSWDSDKTKGSVQSLKAKSANESQSRDKVKDEKNAPAVSERWKRQEIIASEHVQI